jgi:hypothetical protein
MQGILSAEPVARATLITRNNFDQVTFQGQAAFAGGGRCSPHNNKYIPLDLPTLRAPFMLSEDRTLAMRITAAAVRDHFFPIFLPLIENVEDAGLAPLPADQQSFCAVAVIGKGATLVAGGLPAALGHLLSRADLVTLRALSIQKLLRETRENAAKAGIALPPRFTLPRSHEGYSAWFESILERRRLADARWEAKGKKRRPA